MFVHRSIDHNYFPDILKVLVVSKRVYYFTIPFVAPKYTCHKTRTFRARSSTRVNS